MSPTPMWFFFRGTGASWGFWADAYYAAIKLIFEACTGAEIIDVKLTGGGLGRIDGTLVNVKQYVEKRHLAEPSRPVFMGGQSQGAVLAHEVTMCCEWVIGLIELVAPEQGSHLAHRFMPGVWREFAPGSEFTLGHGQRHKAWREAHPDFPILVVWARLDLLIWPPRRACLPSAKNLALGYLWNHFTAPFNPQVWLELRRFIPAAIEHYEAATSITIGESELGPEQAAAA